MTSSTQLVTECDHHYKLPHSQAGNTINSSHAKLNPVTDPIQSHDPLINNACWEKNAKLNRHSN